MGKIISFDVSRLTNAAHFQHMKYVIELSSAISAFQTQDVTRNSLIELNNCFREEDRCLMLAKGSVLTEKITEADRMRDQHYMTYKGMVKSMQTMPGVAIQNAAKKLWRHILDYKINTKTAIDKQTALLTNLVDDLRSKYYDDVNTLNLVSIVDLIDEANSQVENLVRQRAYDSSGESLGALRNARIATDKCYYELLEGADSLYFIFKDPEINDFIDKVNAIITRTKSGASRSRKKTEEVEATALEVENDTTE